MWAMEPCILMRVLSAPAGHIAGYLLRTKGDDDLDKAAHWCDLMMEADRNGYPMATVRKDAPTFLKLWLHTNGQPMDYSNKLHRALLAAAECHWNDAKTYINHLKRERLCESKSESM